MTIIAKAERVRLRVVFFGMGGHFMTSPVRCVAERHDIVGFVLPSQSFAKVVAQSETLTRRTLLLRRAIPCYPVPALPFLMARLEAPMIEFDRERPQDIAQSLYELQPDICCVAGFPCLIPHEILAIPRLGFVNVHPSLLPAYRGPHPFFWAYYEQAETTGVTIHYLDEGEDTGDIILQERIDIPYGLPGQELTYRSTNIGARLLATAIDAIADENVQARENPKLSPTVRASRPDRNAEYVEWDSWGRERVLHFLRGVMPHWYTPPSLVDVVPKYWRARRAIPANDRAPVLTVRRTWRRIQVRCRDGWIEFGAPRYIARRCRQIARRLGV